MADIVESLPQRVTDSEVRAPITLGRAPSQHPNHAMRVPGRPEQARTLRAHLTAVVPHSVADTALTLASELFNNAVTHTRSGDEGGEVVVAVNRLRGRIQVKVVDQGPRDRSGSSPHLRPLDPGREGGLGLRLVDAEASRWGTFHDGDRTTVWFELDLPRAQA
ncbi:serine/threonine protein kinase [Nocardiopsis sp. TSRI0078]|uniref:ATP-binding protein n=1 Tax=unclassified Nocardiopsis TaxID=2649073 RepID=UPI000939325B|nr:ATP-binding protein [Nocardiopsis sp. TSRI0078]OKI23409.1 serine/threonine protein kinase [Nocardiopsis sp. TSRI0078]